MNKLKYPIFYLETTDFNSDGKFINPKIPTHKPILIMVQGEFCGHCTHAKPHFQQFANKYADDILCLTIQVDGNRQTEQGLSSIVNKIDSSYSGAVPHYIYLKDGLKSNTGGMQLQQLESFIQ